MDARPRLAAAIAVAGLLAGVATAAAANGAQRFFLTPGPNGASCEIDVGVPGLPTIAFCVIEPPRVAASRAVAATLSATGRLTVCHGGRCVGNPPLRTPTLAYGRSRTLGPFRCTSLRTGVRCVVTKTGRGFELGVHGVHRL